jgi:methionyl-tRNA formyltransferase
MERHVEAGVDLFFSAEYQFKIPVPSNLKYGVNLHTSLLPAGRGASTLPYLIESYPEAAGLTLHKLTETFDEGDILLSHKINVQSDDSLNTLSVKMHLEAPKILEKALASFDFYYRQASSQENGETWPIPSIDKRLIDWYLPAERLRQQFRSFGHFGSIMRLDKKFWWVTYAEAIQAPSGRPPGHLLFQSNDLLAISCLDGFVCIPKTGIKPVC